MPKIRRFAVSTSLVFWGVGLCYIGHEVIALVPAVAGLYTLALLVYDVAIG